MKIYCAQLNSSTILYFRISGDMFLGISYQSELISKDNHRTFFSHANKAWTVDISNGYLKTMDVYEKRFSSDSSHFLIKDLFKYLDRELNK